MADAAEHGIGNPDYFRERLNNYFHAKYVGELSNWSTDYTFEKIKEFWSKNIDDGGDWRSNLKHLRGTCDRLLESYPSNGAYRLLAFMSDLGLADSHKEILKIFEGYEALWELLLEDRALNNMEIDDGKRWCENTLLGYRRELNVHFASRFLKSCASWVEECTKKFSETVKQ